ncbi:DUF5937 family protein [Streptomyces resistomycificus]|uniref:DUF5937 family protein n=1 Tax=Streptomyces resistomycificus TaxID=67356 RepID=UPI000ADE55CC|nr:DUF5937 family protein [Streptomyces resistomycificus]
MSVVIVLEGASPDRFAVTVSPLAELAASLHVLTGHAHHTRHAPWAEEVTRAAPPAFRAGLRRFAPLWTALRWRGFYPGLDVPVDRLPLDRFAELTAYTLRQRLPRLRLRTTAPRSGAGLGTAPGRFRAA